MAKIIKLPISFEAARRARVQRNEAQEKLNYARRLVEHEFFKLSLLRTIKTPF